MKDEETVNHNQRQPWEKRKSPGTTFPVVFLSKCPDSCHIILNGSRGPRRRRTDYRYQPVTLRSYGNPRAGRSCQRRKGVTNIGLLRLLHFQSCLTFTNLFVSIFAPPFSKGNSLILPVQLRSVADIINETTIGHRTQELAFHQPSRS